MWAETPLLAERKADDVRATGLAFYNAYAGAKGGKRGTAMFNKWLKGLG